MRARLDKVEWRQKMEPRRDPYWQRLGKGLHLGFRKMSAGAPGNWIARFQDGQKRRFEVLGEFRDKSEKERFDAARKAAEAWFAHLTTGGSSEPRTVSEACQAYIARMKGEAGDTRAREEEGFFRRLVYSDPIGKVELSKLSKAHVSGWRDRVLERSGGNKSSFNRNITPLRAALNLALESGLVASPQAWLVNLRPYKGADSRRTLYLTKEQRAALIEEAPEESRALFKTMAMMPFRVGEVAKLKVGYFKPNQRSLEVFGKTGSRMVPLTDAMVAHFAELAKGKLPSAWLVSRADGSQWTKERWAEDLKRALWGARLPRKVVATTLRHCVITDLITEGLDPLSVARLAGTSLAMIDRHYGHLLNEHAREHLARFQRA